MTTRQWYDEEIFELIHLYEEKEFLWNAKHKFYRNRDMKSRAFEEIAIKFSCDVFEVQRKIHNLRSQVSHELKKIRKMKNDGADDTYECKWKFFSALQFVVPSFTATQTASNMDNTKENTEILQTEETSTNQIEETPINQTEKRTHKKRKTETQEDDILKEAIEIMKKPRDDFVRFGDYVALELKSLSSEYYRRLLKSEIRKSITRIADLDELNYWSNTMPSSSNTNLSSSSTPMLSPIVVENTTSPASSGDNATTQDLHTPLQDCL